MNLQRLQAEHHEAIQHLVTREAMSNGRIYWTCRDCATDGSYQEQG